MLVLPMTAFTITIFMLLRTMPLPRNESKPTVLLILKTSLGTGCQVVCGVTYGTTLFHYMLLLLLLKT